MITMKSVTYGIKMENRNRLVEYLTLNMSKLHPRAEVIKVVISKKQTQSCSIQFTAGASKVAINATTGVELFFKCHPVGCFFFFSFLMGTELRNQCFGSIIY